jgi:hypothetical protein
MDLAPLALSLISHHRNQHDRIHRWVRDLIIAAISSGTPVGKIAI